jgi:hypothetical protein
MSGINTVDSHMHDGAHPVTVVPHGTHGIHQFCIAHAHHSVVDAGIDALPRYLMHILHATVVGLVRVGMFQRNGDGMRGETLHMGGNMKQLVG